MVFGRGKSVPRQGFSKQREVRGASNNQYGYVEEVQKPKHTKFESNDDNIKEEPDATNFADNRVPKRKFDPDAKRKPWRLIVRNLPFKTTKEDMQNVCSKFGSFTDIVLPKCKDPKFPNSCAGFAFVQFKDKASANKFKEHYNAHKLNDRLVAVDFALDKDSYETSVFEEKKKLDSTVKEEKPDIKIEPGKDKSAQESEDEMPRDQSDDQGESDESGSDEDEEPTEPPAKRPRQSDTAIVEGRAIFVRNLSFGTAEEDLRSEMEKFGTVKLCLICKFHDSGHSKGTAFVHFASKEEADMCVDALAAASVTIDGRVISGLRAISKENASKIEKEKLAKAPKDKRNMHLLRAGIIREGTAAANAMSEQDAQKRNRLAATARDKLNNLHNFVSPTRLVVHNLPVKMTDAELKKLCWKSAGRSEARVVECRIWKDMNKKDAEGKARSKGFGFVAFGEHVDALACLTALNNNPTTFTNERRPIVEFSIENLQALKLKESRLLKSKGKQVTIKELSENIKQQVDASKVALSRGGQKPLPSHLGPKVRHRDQKKTKKEKSHKAVGGKKDKGVESQPKSGVKKASRKKIDKRKVTKYLALA